MYTLEVIETGKAAATYHYQVKDQDGKVITERKSNREYVAATIDGAFYFGRLDLVGKGAHGAQIKYFAAKGLPQVPVAYRK